MPAQTGRVAVVTGANSGIGFEVASALALRGATVVLACRDLTRAAAAADRVGETTPGAATEVVELDLASLTSVRSASAELLARFSRIDLLIENAGVSMPPQARSADGFDLQLATNHLSHFALVGLLFDRIAATPGSRVITLTSMIHPIGRIDFDDLHQVRRRRYSRGRAYAQSKLATLLFAVELDRRLRRAGSPTIALSAHPGSARTAIARHIPRVERALKPLAGLLQQSASAGALPILRAATDPAAVGGELYGPAGPLQWRGHPTAVRISARANARETAARLWEVSEQLTGVRIPIDPAS